MKSFVLELPPGASPPLASRRKEVGSSLTKCCLCLTCPLGLFPALLLPPPKVCLTAWFLNLPVGPYAAVLRANYFTPGSF